MSGWIQAAMQQNTIAKKVYPSLMCLKKAYE